MTEKEAKVQFYTKKIEKATSYLENKYKKDFNSEFISSLLGHYYERDDVHMFLIFHDAINEINLEEILESEFQSVIDQLTFNSNEFDFLLENNIEKATIKNNGFQWIIHKNDADPFPSSPHAHEFKLNIKLHLGNGEMYRHKTKVGSLSKKEFLRLREKILERGISLPT